MSTANTGAKNNARYDEFLAQVQEDYPEYVYFLNADSVFGEDVRQLLIRAVNQGYTKSRFISEFKQTQYYLTNQKNIRDWNALGKSDKDALAENKYAEIAEAYGEVLPDEAIGRQIATEAARRGLTGIQLRNYVMAESVRLAGPAKNKLRFTEEADKLNATLAQYGYKPSEREIYAALTGEAYNGEVINQQVLINRAKTAAKGSYGHLAEQLDAGLTLEDIFKNYRQYAASILEIDPSQIDFTKDPKWLRAFGSPETGQMSLTDWVRTLKTDDIYEYQFTNQAAQEASSLVLGLERAFGFRR